MDTSLSVSWLALFLELLSSTGMQSGQSKAQRKTRPCAVDDIPVTDRKGKQAMVFSGKVVRWRPQLAGMPCSHPVDRDRALAIE
jgi:hypothetical protein